MVDVRSAQRPPAQVRVVVLGVGLHTTGVIVDGTAGKESIGSVWPSLLGLKHTGPNVIDY